MVTIDGALHGACTRSQALEALGQHGLRTALRTGTLVPVWPRVLVDGKRSLALHTRAAAALLTAGRGAVLCGQTAARLHGCSAARTATIHVRLPYDRWARGHRGIRIHNGVVEPDDVVDVDGLPVLALDHVVSDLLCDDETRVAIACADQAMALWPEGARPAFAAAVERRIEQRRDRRGTKRAVALLELVDGRAESPPESWLRLMVIEAGFAVPEVQYRILDLDGNVVCRPDLAWPELRIALEYDGYESHFYRADRDAARDADLARRGWIVVRANVEDIRNPRRLLDELAKAFGERKALVRTERLQAAG
jgi:hypothetical protein